MGMFSEGFEEKIWELEAENKRLSQQLGHLMEFITWLSKYTPLHRRIKKRLRALLEELTRTVP